MSDGLGKDALSPRELEIAQAYARGASYRGIAERLFIAPTTVRTHLRNIYEKLGISNKAELFSLLATTLGDGSHAARQGAGPGGAREISNLPTFRNRLIGREEQLQAIQDLVLQDEVGLVTLTGPGGSGKTRLGLAVAAKQGHAKRAARLAGAQEAMRSEIGTVMSPNHLSEYETGLAIARQALSEPAFADAFAKGKAMSIEGAARYALSKEDETPPPSGH